MSPNIPCNLSSISKTLFCTAALATTGLATNRGALELLKENEEMYQNPVRPRIDFLIKSMRQYIGPCVLDDLHTCVLDNTHSSLSDVEQKSVTQKNEIENLDKTADYDYREFAVLCVVSLLAIFMAGPFQDD